MSVQFLSQDPIGVVDLLGRLVRVDTTNPGGDERGALEVLAEVFRSRGLEVTIDEYREGNANLVAKAHFGPGPTIMLNSHIDVVPAGTGWTHEPFGAGVHDGKVYGRGAADAKGSLAGMAAALTQLLAEPQGLSGTILYTAVGDEEVGSSGVHALMREVSADACIVGEPTNLRLLAAHKGSVRPVVEVRGLAAHAATPEAGRNAIVAISDLLARVEALAGQLRERRHPLVGNPTITPVLIEGGQAPNAVPESCRVTFDRRLVPGETSEQALAEVQEVIDAFNAGNEGFSASIIECAPSTGGPSETAADDPFVMASQGALKSIGEDPELGGLVVNCDMTTFRAHGIPTVVFGPGTLEAMHVLDEYVEIDQLERAVVAYREILRSLLSPAGSNSSGTAQTNQ